MRYHILGRGDYDKSFKIQKQPLAFYSPDKMRQMYPDGEYTLVGEAVKKSNLKQIGGLQVLDQIWSVVNFGGHNRFLYQVFGYVAVGEGKYIALVKSRLPFLIILFSLVLVLIAAIVGVVILLGMQGVIPVPGVTTAPTTTVDPVIPDHPLPPIDTGAEELPEDEEVGDKVESESGGGSVSMIYSTVVNTYLDQDTYSVNFKNPTRSNHDVQVELYIISGGKDYLMAKSGLLEAGYRINFMSKLEGAPPLQEGIYTGYYLVHYFDPITGQKALIESKITDVSIYVGRA